MFLHILSDALGSVGVIISTILIKFYDWQWSDPLCSILIAILTLIGTWPLLKSSATILLQGTPPELEKSLDKAYMQVSSLQGIISLSRLHFWELSNQQFVGSICVQVTRGTDCHQLRYAIREIFRDISVYSLNIQIENESIDSY